MWLKFLFIFIRFQIEITELDEFAQAAFRGYTSLWTVFRAAYFMYFYYYTNENILVRKVFFFFLDYVDIKPLQ